MKNNTLNFLWASSIYLCLWLSVAIIVQYTLIPISLYYVLITIFAILPAMLLAEWLSSKIMIKYEQLILRG